MKKAVKKEEKELKVRLTKGKKPTKKQLIELASVYAGNMADIARACGVSRQSVCRWKDASPDFEEAIKDGKVVLVDLALNGLRHHLINKSEKTVHYTLDRLARDKGFGRMVQIQDKSKFQDQLEEMSDDELMDLLETTTKRIENG